MFKASLWWFLHVSQENRQNLRGFKAGFPAFHSNCYQSGPHCVGFRKTILEDLISKGWNLLRLMMNEASLNYTEPVLHQPAFLLPPAVSFSSAFRDSSFPGRFSVQPVEGMHDNLLCLKLPSRPHTVNGDFVLPKLRLSLPCDPFMCWL